MAGSASMFGYTEVGSVEDPKLILMYGRCIGRATNITVIWNLNLFAPITFTFQKLCGGGPAVGFGVKMSTIHGVQDAIIDGKPTAKFSEGKEVMGITTDATTFWITSTNGPLTIQKVTVSQAPSAIFVPQLLGDLADLTTEYSLNGETALQLRYQCERQGAALVSLTFQLEKYRSCSLVFSKRCGPPGAQTQGKTGKSWSPTGLMLGLTAAFIVIGSVVACIRSAGKKNKVVLKQKHVDPEVVSVVDSKSN